MPIRPEMRDKYPPRKEWLAIRARIMARASNRCEFCRAVHHAVWSVEEDGARRPTAGNRAHDEAGNGELSYAEAREFCEEMKMIEPDVRYFVIVLTIAHLDQDPTNNADDNLRALCQRCHNRHDMPHRRKNAARTLARKKHAPTKGIGFSEVARG